MLESKFENLDVNYALHEIALVLPYYFVIL